MLRTGALSRSAFPHPIRAGVPRPVLGHWVSGRERAIIWLVIVLVFVVFVFGR